MQALLALRSWHWRAPDWAAAGVAGFAAGAVLMVLDLLWSSLFNADGPWRTSHMIAPLFLGTEPLRTTGYGFHAGVVSVALAVHYVLGVVFGLVMGAIMAQLHADARPGRALATGGILGIALYLVNFHGLPAFFPWLAELRGGDTLAAHVVFGCVAGLLYFRLKRTRGES
ncbi:hypothetical protein [Ramlibacter sp.]|uniref:hypothetical protein n=1 Tax=Ramlibacter sp. TaxID=1917967 RepID=UPI00262778D9|nr:hypothetical protein [Ramlibacter sp.]MDB5955946.1 putative rane protein [Ramlibacter sp.]